MAGDQAIPFQLGIRSNPARRRVEGNAVLTNGYAENIGEEGKAQWILYAHSGYEAFATLTSADGAVKCMLEMDGVGYVVAGTKLYSVTTAGTVTSLGTLTGSSGMITMASNRRSPHRQIFIVSANGLWWVWSNGTLTAAPDADLPAPNSVTELHGYAIFTHSDGQFSISDPNAATVDALAIARAESNPDGLSIGMRRGSDLVLMGPQSTEFWADVGGVDFAFSPQERIGTGIYAAGSACDVSWAKPGDPVNATLAFAATNARGEYIGVVLLQSFQPVKISTQEVDRVIAAEEAPASITSCFRVVDGHAFYSISGTNWTWEYDLTTGAWNPRKTTAMSRWRIARTLKVGSLLLYGDYETGTLYKANSSLFTESGTAITWTVQPPPVHAYPYQLQINRVFLDVVPADGLTYSVSNTIALSYSEDGGSTFSTARNAIIGSSGRPLTKVVEHGFGVFHESGVTFKFEMSAALVNGLAGGAVLADKLNRAA